MSLNGATAAHRFGLGARPGEIEAASRSPKNWLMDQLGGPAEQPQPLGDQELKPGGELVAGLLQLRKQRAEMKREGDLDAGALKDLRKSQTAIVLNEMAARFVLGFTTGRPFAEHLVWFWSNHFVVSTMNGGAAPLVGAFEREAIRPHINGKFEDMTLAVVRHPAMLLYLNNAQSIGPHSRAGMFSGKGLNENLGRELMELYTLGVDGGYTQADVIAMAKLLTGWSLDRDGGDGFRFYPARHEPGDVTLRGKIYPGGYEGCVAAITDLARDPATARHVARKFATYFIADDPSPESVARLEKTFNDTHGDLRALAETAVGDPAAWSHGPGKMRSPVEYVTATFRFLALPRPEADSATVQRQVRGAMAGARMMGEFPLSAPSPKGWPLNSGAWSGANAVLDRVEWARQVGQRIPAGVDAEKVADMGLGPLLQPATRTAMAQSGSPGEAIALVLASPEFQRR